MIGPVTVRADSRVSDGETAEGELVPEIAAAAFVVEGGSGFSSLQPAAKRNVPNDKSTWRSRFSFLSRTFTIPTKPRVWNKTRCRDAAKKRSPLDTFPREPYLGPPFRHESRLPDSRSQCVNRTPELREGFLLSG